MNSKLGISSLARDPPFLNDLAGLMSWDMRHFSGYLALTREYNKLLALITYLKQVGGDTSCF